MLIAVCRADPETLEIITSHYTDLDYSGTSKLSLHRLLQHTANAQAVSEDRDSGLV